MGQEQQTMKEMNDTLFKSFTKLQSENSEHLKELREKGDQLSINKDKVNDFMDSLAKQEISYKLIQTSYQRTRD
jgi:hypothetical protein